MKNNQKLCPVTGRPIPRRYAVHSSVIEACIKAGTVRDNPRKGTLRTMVYVGPR